MSIEAMKQALEALSCSNEYENDSGHRCSHCDDYVDRNGLVRAALRAAIAEASMQRLTDVQQEMEKEPVAWETIEKIAQERYKVGPCDTSMFYRFAVLAGNGTQQLYIGREIECQNMARKFAGAFLDGAFLYEKMATSPRREWAGLTDEEIDYMRQGAQGLNFVTFREFCIISRAIETKLKEKNS
jgi:hypothetical protein